MIVSGNSLKKLVEISEKFPKNGVVLEYLARIRGKNDLKSAKYPLKKSIFKI
jgi:hypothetical protein